MKELISVIIPTYNRRNCIENAVNSVLKQDYNNWELIIVDDGSVDETNKVIKKYLFDSRIRYYFRNNMGVCAARNFGIKNAKGKYIALLDSDDEFYENKLSEQLKGMLDYGIDFSLCNLVEFRENKKIPQRFNFNGSFVISREDIINYRIPMSASFMMFRRDIFNRHTFDEKLPSSNDFDFVLRVSANNKIIFVDKKLVKNKKTFKSNRISTNYEAKIKGYEKLLEKIDNGKYILNKKEINILKGRTLLNLGLFCFLDNKIKSGVDFIKKGLQIHPGLSKKSKIKFKILLSLSKSPFLLIRAFSLVKKIWRMGLIQN